MFEIPKPAPGYVAVVEGVSGQFDSPLSNVGCFADQDYQDGGVLNQARSAGCLEPPNEGVEKPGFGLV